MNIAIGPHLPDGGKKSVPLFSVRMLCIIVQEKDDVCHCMTMQWHTMEVYIKDYFWCVYLWHKSLKMYEQSLEIPHHTTLSRNNWVQCLLAPPFSFLHVWKQRRKGLRAACWPQARVQICNRTTQLSHVRATLPSKPFCFSDPFRNRKTKMYWQCGIRCIKHSSGARWIPLTLIGSIGCRCCVRFWTEQKEGRFWR